jgi:hypothetical protein
MAPVEAALFEAGACEAASLGGTGSGWRSASEGVRCDEILACLDRRLKEGKLLKNPWDLSVPFREGDRDPGAPEGGGGGGGGRKDEKLASASPGCTRESGRERGITRGCPASPSAEATMTLVIGALYWGGTGLGEAEPALG